MATVLSKFVGFTNRHPILRGILAYGALWPTSSIIQQTIAGKHWDNYDWMNALRFSIWGAFFVAPTFYCWVRISTILFPVNNLKSSIKKVLAEQCTYGPCSLVSFFYGMSLLEGKSLEHAKKEVQNKFIPTYKVAICFWPMFQTINYTYVSMKNRVPLTGLASTMWCCFLAYMHEKQLKDKHIGIGRPSDALEN